MAEKARRERMRIVDRGFTSYDLSEDGQRVLLPLSGRAVRLRPRGDRGQGARAGRRRAGGARSALLARRHARWPTCAANDLYVADVASGTRAAADPGRHRAGHPRAGRVRRPGGDGPLRGLLLVARLRARWPTPRWTSAGWSASPSPTPPTRSSRPPSFPYPRPGQANAKVRLGVIAAARRGARSGCAGTPSATPTWPA